MGIRSIIIAVPLAALALAAEPSRARDVTTASVIYAGLDLASPAGVTELDKRLARATRSVCGERWSRHLGDFKEYSLCIRETSARVRMQRERVIAAYLARGGEQLAAR